MTSQPQCVNAILFWSFEREYFSSLQSVRSWSFAGLEHVILRFVIPATKHEIKGLRLQIQPCPIGTRIQSINFLSCEKVYKWELAYEGQSDFGTLSAAVSPFAEPTRNDVESAMLTVEAREADIRRLKHGGTLEMALSAKFTCEPSFSAPSFETASSPSESQPVSTLSSKSKFNTKGAVARQLQTMHSEVNRLADVLGDVYSSNSWTKTQWCRELASKWRNLPYWRVALIVSRQLKLLKKQSAGSTGKLTQARKVSVIVPVYGGFNHVSACIRSVVDAAVTVPYEIVVIDDASPQEDIKRYLRNLSSSGKITLLENETNRGFTATVNRGMSLYPDTDVVLLNSDTTVSHDWLGRLQLAAYSKKTIGSVTPFSNNASICSYPVFGAENEIPDGFDPAELDEIFSKVNERKLAEIPTAVGFCMYIKRECLDKVGLFDAETFPGYGEENDFCERALRLGWKHVLAADTFVYHEGGASYGEQTKQRMLAAYDAISKLHPNYQPAVRKFFQLNPLQPLRENVDLQRLKLAKKATVLMVLHGLAGGTLKHVNELAEHFGEQVNFLTLRVIGERVEIKWANKGEGFVKTFLLNAEWKDVISLLKSLPIQRIHIHHFLGLELKINTLIEELGLPYDYTVHDYYAVCPQGWLCDHTQRYCGQPDENGCNDCLKVLPHKHALSIQEWRQRYSKLIENAQRVFVPSSDALSRFSRYLPPRSYTVTPHIDSNLVTYPDPKARPIRLEEPLRIVVLGLLNNEKGASVLDECAQDVVRRNLPLEFHFLGAAHQPLATRPAGALISYGVYAEADIQELLMQVRPHIAWFPAQCPETYSYTLSACLEAGLPIAAPNIGAFPERLSGRNWTWIMDWQSMAYEWNDLFVQIMENNFAHGQQPSTNEFRSLQSRFAYDKDYLAPIIAGSRAMSTELTPLYQSAD